MGGYPEGSHRLPKNMAKSPMQDNWRRMQQVPKCFTPTISGNSKKMIQQMYHLKTNPLESNPDLELYCPDTELSAEQISLF